MSGSRKEGRCVRCVVVRGKNIKRKQRKERMLRKKWERQSGEIRKGNPLKVSRCFNWLARGTRSVFLAHCDGRRLTCARKRSGIYHRCHLLSPSMPAFMCMYACLVASSWASFSDRVRKCSEGSSRQVSALMYPCVLNMYRGGLRCCAGQLSVCLSPFMPTCLPAYPPVCLSVLPGCEVG